MTALGARRAPVAAFRRVNVAVPTPVTGSLNVAVRFPVWLAPVAPIAGVRADSVGTGPVVKVQLVAGSARPAASLMPDVSVAVYRVSAARVPFGSNVATRVVGLY